MKLQEIHLASNNLLETKRFYKEVLGLEAESTSDSLLRIRIGSTSLFFFQSEVQKPFYHYAFNIPSQLLQACRAWLLERVELIPTQEEEDPFMADFTDWNAKSFYFYDNNGNICECIARYDLPETDEKEFSSRSFLNISEIGLVCDEVIGQCQSLVEELSLASYKRQGQLTDNICPMGDENGLFIVVKRDRVWYPYLSPAAFFPLKVKAENKGQAFELLGRSLVYEVLKDV